MSIQFRCPKCTKLVQAPDAAAGKSAKCPACGELVTVPDDDPLAGLDEFIAAQSAPAPPAIVPSPPTQHGRKSALPARLFIVLAVLAVGAIAFRAFNNRTPARIATVATLPDAFRRLELRGYGHVKDSSTLGQDFILYQRTEPDAEYTAEISKWSGTNRIAEIVFSCHTDEKGFENEESALDFWDKMKHDLYAMMNCSDDYHRAVADLHPVEEKEMPVRRHEGRATTADGWQILIIEDMRHYKTPYKQRNKFWARVGVVWATHLDTSGNIPRSAVREFDRQMEEMKNRSTGE